MMQPAEMPTREATPAEQSADVDNNETVPKKPDPDEWQPFRKRGQFSAFCASFGVGRLHAQATSASGNADFWVRERNGHKIVSYREFKGANANAGPLVGLWLTVVFLFWLSTLFVIGEFQPKNLDSAGIGDSFGAVNALFSGAAFAFLLVTLNLQRKELKLQREELADTREVLREQKGELEGQKDAMNRQLLAMQSQANSLAAQAVEATFFRLLAEWRRQIGLLRMAESRQSGKDRLNGRTTIQKYDGVAVTHRLAECVRMDGFSSVWRRSGEVHLTSYLNVLRALLSWLRTAPQEPRDAIWLPLVTASMGHDETWLLSLHLHFKTGAENARFDELGAFQEELGFLPPMHLVISEEELQKLAQAEEQSPAPNIMP